eukprot:7317982-Lingulodinium_polyedra.AAC.1
MQPADGGMGASEVNFEEEFKGLCLQVDGTHLSQSHVEQAEKDLRGTAAYFSRAPKRRACPSWSVPLEVWWMLVHPDDRREAMRRSAG